ncbi:condensation domain-containing protein [Streptomyces sp. NPDC002589]|uniref:condensation domain-containing protein n=1 Tax=Streptomyces sp. NPDC002589 TaxID=3154420 RepID=UPI00331BB987
MLIATLSECRVRPGLLREWRLDESPFHEAARATGEAVPASYNQEWHLKSVSKLTERGLGVPPWIGFGFELPGPLDAEAFRETLRAWVVRHDTLRSAFRMTVTGVERFSIPPATVSVRDTVVGKLSDGDDIPGRLQVRIDAAAGAFRRPSHVVETVERDDSTTVFVAMDHAHADGYSVMTAVAEWQHLYGAALAGGRPTALPPAGSYVDFGLDERAAARRIGAGHPAVGHWSRFLEGGGDRLFRFPLDLGVADGELLTHAKLDVRLLDAAETEAVEEVCHLAHGGFLAGLFAGLAAVSYDITGEPVYRTVMPVHTRSRPELLHSMGWYVGLAPVEISLGTAGSFRELVPGAHRSLGTALRSGRVPIVRIAELLGISEELERRMPEVFPFVSFIDTRVIPGVRQWPEWNARTVVRMRTRGSKVNIWVHRTHDGLWLTARYPGTESAETGIADFFDRLRGVLHCVAKTGDHTLDRSPRTTGGTP